MTKFNDSMRKSFEDTINSFIDVKRHSSFEDFGVDMDFKLIDEGIHIQDNFFSVIMDGTFYASGKKYDSTV